MAFDWASFIGQNVGQAFAQIVGAFKVPPEKALEAQTETVRIQAELTEKLIGQVNTEIQSAADIIKAEANSQSWLPRNVRPLLLLLWGVTITANIFIPIVARFWFPAIQPLVVPDWVYKLTAIGFTGYVTARTWEKVKDADN